jgi:hypothetical protein
MGFISVFYKVLESYTIETLTEEKAQEYYACSLDELKYIQNKHYIKVKFIRPKTVPDIDKLKIWAEENNYTGKLVHLSIMIWCRKNNIPQNQLTENGLYCPNIKLFYKLAESGEKEETIEWVFPSDMYSGKIYDYYKLL